jgi:hypothetical protein
MITVADVFDAIEKNGLPKTKEVYYDFSYPNKGKDSIKSACALGQAGYNLDISPHTLYYRLNDIVPGLGARITYLNDNTRYGFKRIANILREEYADYLTQHLATHITPLDEYLMENS